MFPYILKHYSTSTSFSLKILRIPFLGVNQREDFSLQQVCIRQRCRVIIPEGNRTQMLNSLQFEYFGIVKIKSLACSYVWWPDIDKDIKTLSQNYTVKN